MRKRVLIVNDSNAVRRTLGLVLRRAGYEVEATDRPETALAKAPEVDLMLCDSVVGKDTTGSVARRAMQRNARLRVLLWVGAGEQSRSVIKQELGSFWKLPKPIDPPLLLEHLARALR